MTIRIIRTSGCLAVSAAAVLFLAALPASCGSSTEPAIVSPLIPSPLPLAAVPSGPSTAVVQIEAFEAGPRDSNGNFLAFDPKLLLREIGGSSAAVLTAIVFTIGDHGSINFTATGCMVDPIIPAGGTWDTSNKITYYCRDAPEPSRAAAVAVRVTFTDAKGRHGEVRADLGN
jgi:hypothetical protein